MSTFTLIFAGMKKRVTTICAFLMAMGQAFSQMERAPLPVNSTHPARAGAFIDVNTSQYPQSSYSIEDLVKKVLFSGGNSCTGTVSNVIVSPNLSASSVTRSWGYFNKANATFPFDEGIVLSTGHAGIIGNNYRSATLDTYLGSSTDNDLASALGVYPSLLVDATYIQFDFVPNSNQISFEYIFASEEYLGDYACNYTDGFALLLKKVGEPSYTNLAVLPSGAGAVSSSNIRPRRNACDASNEQYFHGLNTTNVETNFEGRTIPLTATATVEPGETYRFKIVLADFMDSRYDTGVFLKAGSFNAGIQLTDASGNPLPSTIEMCEGSTQNLSANVGITGANYQWYFNGNPIPGATQSSYTATQGGIYKVQIQVPGTACNESAQITINALPSPQTNAITLTQCGNTSGNATFDLVSAQPLISSTAGAVFSFYQNQADALAGNGNTIANPSAYVSASGTVYARVEVGNCSAVVAVTLSAIPKPSTPVITSSGGRICGSGTVTLTSNVATGNLWSTGETTQSITVTAPGVYTLVNTQNGCSSDTAAITISGDADPNLNITGTNAICSGNTTTLTAVAQGNVVSYLWSNGQTTPSITVGNAGTYTVTVTMQGGCQFQAQTTVTVGETPIANPYQVSVCSSSGSYTFDLPSYNAQISTTAGAVFAYYTNQTDALAGNGNTIANPMNYVSNGGVVYVRVSVGNCFALAELRLEVTQSPVPVITQSANAICGTTPVVLTSNSPTGNLWSTGETTQSITVTTGGTYTLTVSNGNCASAPVSVVVAQSHNPNLTITGNLSFCQGGNTTLTANTNGAVAGYLWSNGQMTPSITVNTAGTYSVTITTPEGCEYTQSVTVNREDTAQIRIANPAQITCASPTVTLQATVTAIPAGATLVWTASNGGNIVSGANTLTPVVNQPGVYTLTVTNPAGLRCAATNSVTVVRNVTPPAIILSASKLTICEGESVTLTASGAQTYTWNGFTGSGNTQVVSPTSTTTYTVTGVGVNGCQGNTATVTIHVVENITSPLSDIEFCQGDTAVLDAGAGANYTYLWSTGATTQTITIDTAGEYSVTIHNGVCSKTFTVNASYTEIPKIKEITFTNHTLTVVMESSSSNLEYSIDGGISWQSNPVFSNILQDKEYMVLVREKGAQCYASAKYHTFVMPNAITPNADGVNDYVDFSIIGKKPEFKAIIYDRYGKEVFRTAPHNMIWRGNDADNKIPTATYWYQIVWRDEVSGNLVENTGWILVKNR